jgi:hypothetical protein
MDDLTLRCRPGWTACWALRSPALLRRAAASVTQAVEARAVLDRLVAGIPAIPMLLTHENQWLKAAYLPGQPIHESPRDLCVRG